VIKTERLDREKLLDGTLDGTFLFDNESGLKTTDSAATAAQQTRVAQQKKKREKFQNRIFNLITSEC